MSHPPLIINNQDTLESLEEHNQTEHLLPLQLEEEIEIQNLSSEKSIVSDAETSDTSSKESEEDSIKE